MPKTLLAQLVVSLKDELSANAGKVTGALRGVEAAAASLGAHGTKDAKGLKLLGDTLKATEQRAREFAAATQGGLKWGAGFDNQISKLRLSAQEIEKLKASWRSLQGEIRAGGDGGFRRNLVNDWKNNALTSITAVRAAQQSLTDEAITSSKRQLAEQRKAEAVAARERLREATAEAKRLDRVARDTAKAETTAVKASVKAEADAAREKGKNESAARKEVTRVAAAEARARTKVEADAARESARVSREAARTVAAEARQAQRDARIADRAAIVHDRRFGRGAGAIGRSVVRNIGYAAGVGSGAYVVGRGVKAGVGAGGQAMREEARDYLAGMSDNTARLSAMALQQSGQYKSLTSTSLHSLYRESASTSLGMGGTALLAPDLAQGLTVIQSLKGKEAAVTQLTGFMRALDTLGKNVEPTVVRSLLDGMARAAGVQGMEYDPGKIFTFAKQSRSAGGALSTEFLNEIVPSLIADMGPSAPGTALATLMSSVVGGTRSAGNTKAKMELQKKMGLRQKNGRLSETDRDTITQNPHLYAWDRIIPALEKDGVDISNEGAVSEAMNRLYTRTVADVFTKMISQKSQYQNTQRLIRNAPGLAGADKLETLDPYVAVGGLTSQMVNAAPEIAKPIITTIMPALSGLAGGLNTLATKLRENPEFSKQFGAVGTGVAAGAAAGAGIGGIAALLAGSGLSGAALAALRGALLGGAGGGALVLGYMGMQFLSSLNQGGAEGSKQIYGSALPGAAGDYDRSMQAQRERNRDPEAARGRAMMRIGSPIDIGPDIAVGINAQAADTGQSAGTTLAQSIVAGFAANIGLVQAQAAGLMEHIRSLFSGGVNVPVNLSSEGARVFKQVTGQPVGEGSAPARASGGHVSAGSLYRVNEFGEEFFQPASDGRIVNPKGRASGASTTGESNINAPVSLHFNVQGGDASEIARTVMAELEHSFRDIVRGSFSDYGLEVA